MIAHSDSYDTEEFDLVFGKITIRTFIFTIGDDEYLDNSVLTRLAYALLKRENSLEETNIKKFHKEVFWKRVSAKQVKIKYAWEKYLIRENKPLKLRVKEKHKAPFLNHHKQYVFFIALTKLIKILERSNEEFIWDKFFPGFDHTERLAISNIFRRRLLDDEPQQDVYLCGDCHQDIPCRINYCMFHTMPNTVFSSQLEEGCIRVLCTQCNQQFRLTDYDCNFN